jgi:hypothetical protein
LKTQLDISVIKEAFGRKLESGSLCES